MKCLVYDLNDKNYKDYAGGKHYIFQYVKNRKLSNVNHSHRFYEITAVTDGSCTQVINEKEYTFKKDSLVILRPGDRHFFTSQSDDVAVVALSVSVEEFEAFAKAYSPELKSEIDCKAEPCIIKDSGISAGLYAVCSGALKNDNEYEYKMLLSMFIKLYIEQSERKTDLPKNVEAAMREIRSAENLKRGIPAFVELSHYSRSHLSRIIKSCFNMSLHDYILNLRLDAAYNALILSSESIEDIAESVGYMSLSHFNKIFKSRYGVTPASVRKYNGFLTA